MYVTTQITKNYYDRCGDLFASLSANFDKEKVLIGCIGFEPDDCPFKTYYVSTENLLYNGYSCATRESYMCLQHGEFMKFIGDVDEPILNIDADVIIQDRLEILEPNEGELIVTPACYPYPSLREVSKRKTLRLKDPVELESKYNLDRPEFSAAIICATPQTWRDFYAEFEKCFDDVNLFDHHAAGMFIMNCVAYEHFDVTMMEPSFHNATWFHGTKTYFENGYLMESHRKVRIIHTKFEGEWKWM